MSAPLRVRAVVAAKDAEATVGETVAALLSLDEVDEVLVVDDGSADATADEARRAGAWVLRLPANRGKGGAVATGVEAMADTDVFLLVDADVGTTAARTSAVLEPVLAGEADLVVGVLPPAGRRGGFGLVRDLARAGIARACGLRTAAPLSGQRAVRADLLRRLDLASGFGLEAAMTVDAVRAGARVSEVPVEMDHRHTGRGPAGFVHRARQGLHLARALWPRLTSNWTRTALPLALAVLTVLACLWSASRAEVRSVPATARAERVLLVGMPGLAWSDLESGDAPNLRRLLERGALAAMTVRGRSPHPSVTEGYATLGAGGRVAATDLDGSAEGTDDGRVVVNDVSRLKAGAGRNAPMPPGSLGDALHAAGLRSAVVGNADLAPGISDLAEPGRHPDVLRPAAVALMDSKGVVDTGEVGHADLLVTDPQAPFGLRADPDRVTEATARALERADVVLVDSGDLSRLQALADLSPPAWFLNRARRSALAASDDLLGRITSDLPAHTLVMVVPVVPPGSRWHLVPVVADGAGVVRGHLHSPSTRRAGLVTLTDVAPTVLSALGAEVPAGMVGHPFRYVPGQPEVAGLARFDRDADFRERLYLPVVATFVAVQAVAYLAVVLVLGRLREGPGRWRRPLRLAALAFAALPLATYLLRAVPWVAAGGVMAGGLALLAIDAALVALVAKARRSPLSPLSWLLGLTLVVIVVDVATGGRLQQVSLMGYTPHTAGRFYGLGNTTFAVLAAASLLLGSAHVEHAPRKGEALAAVAALFAVVVVVDGAPSLGDDVGGILTLVPVFGLTLIALSGRRLSWRRVGALAVLTLVALALFTAVDLARPPEQRTHLARQVESVIADGPGALATTIARKAEVNVRILGASTWTWMVPVIAVFMLELLVRQRRGAELLPPGSARRIGVLSALAAGLLGAAVNDSGVVVTALVLVYVGPFLVLLALARDEARRPVLLEPVPGPAGPAVARPAP